MKSKTEPRLRNRHRMGKAPISLTFTPAFYEELDGRYAVKKEILKRLRRLKAEAGVDSYQKEIMAENAIFLALQIETMRVKAISGEEELDMGLMNSTINSLTSLLTKLGLEKRGQEKLSKALHDILRVGA